MLTGYQCEVVAYALNGEILCPECAAKETSQVTLDKAERGLSTGADISPWIRYELDEYISSQAEEFAHEQADEDDVDGWQAAYDAAPDYEPCGSCGREIS